MEKENNVKLILLHILFHIVCFSTFIIFARLLFKGINITGAKAREEFEGKVANLERDNQIELFGYYDENRITLKIEEIDGYDEYLSNQCTWDFVQLFWTLPLTLSIGGYFVFIVYHYGVDSYD